MHANTLEPFKCTECGHELSIIDLHRAAARIMNSLRKARRGKERVIYKCNCGGLFSAREFRVHESKCPEAPPRGDVLANPMKYRADEQERERYLSERKSQQPAA